MVKYIFESEDGQLRSIVDYMIYLRTIEGNVKDVWVEKYTNMITDHKLVIIKILEEKPIVAKGKEFMRIKIREAGEGKTDKIH